MQLQKPLQPLPNLAISRNTPYYSQLIFYLFTISRYGRDRSLLYRNMSSAALSDLDWEVKLQALEFWQVIIDEELTQQGMLNGSFPEYTFSKEKQKIVKYEAFFRANIALNYYFFKTGR